MNLLVLSCSLNPESNSAILAQHAFDNLKQSDHQVELFDLRQHPLPFCDGGEAYSHPNTQLFQQKLAAAQGVLIACPIYNFSVSAAAKNTLEMGGKQAWASKIVGMLYAAGGQASYLAGDSLATSLMNDFRCIIVPRTVYATGNAFTDQKLTDPAIADRITGLTQDFVNITSALQSITEKAPSS